MTTSQTPFLSEVLQGVRISPRALGYFRARLKNRLHDLVLSTFLALERQQRLSKATLAKRLERKPEQLTRWLGAPGNWELDTVSDLLLGMGYELQMDVRPITTGVAQPIAREAQVSTDDTPQWLRAFREFGLPPSSPSLTANDLGPARKASTEPSEEATKAPFVALIQISGSNEPVKNGALEALSTKVRAPQGISPSGNTLDRYIRTNPSQYREVRT